MATQINEVERYAFGAMMCTVAIWNDRLERIASYKLVEFMTCFMITLPVRQYRMIIYDTAEQQ